MGDYVTSLPEISWATVDIQVPPAMPVLLHAADCLDQSCFDVPINHSWGSPWSADYDSLGLEWSLRFCIFWQAPKWCWCCWSMDHTLKGRRLEYWPEKDFEDLSDLGGNGHYDWWCLHSLWARCILFWLRSNPAPPAFCSWKDEGSESERGFHKVMRLVSDSDFQVSGVSITSITCSCYMPAARRAFSAVLQPDRRGDCCSVQLFTSASVMPNA